MDPERKFLEEITPFADVRLAQRPIGVLSWSAHKVDGGRKSCRVLSPQPCTALGVNRPGSGHDPTRLSECS